MCSQDIQLPGLMASLLDRDTVERIAREQGAVQRERSFEPFVLLSVLLLGFKLAPERNLASLCRLYGMESRKPLAESSFRGHFHAGLEACFQALFAHVAEHVLTQGRVFQGLLARFADILVADSTILTLHSALAHVFPGVATAAAAKVHLMLSATGTSPARVRLSEGTRSDHRQIAVSKWVKDKLLLMDLGYTSLALLARIAKHGGLFVARLKDDANPTVVADAGKRVAPVAFGTYLREGRDYDLTCEFRYTTRIYLGKKREHRRQFRVVCLWNPDEGNWMWYVTNLPANTFTPKEIGVLYRARWLVELVFDELKTGYGLDRFKTQNPHVVGVLVYSALLTMLVSRHLLVTLCREWNLHYASLTCWWRLFCEATPKLLEGLLYPERWKAEVENRLKAVWHKTLKRAKRKHPNLLEQVDQGIFYGEGLHA